MALKRMIDGATVEMTAQQEADFLASLPVRTVTVEEYRRAIQLRIDATAQSRRYDSGVTCSSYLGSTNDGWAAEAAAFVSWRDAVWGYAYGELAKVQAGDREQPSVEYLLAELPAINWPA